MLVPGLRRFGYEDEADRLVRSCLELIERHGFSEYYNPLSGEGLAARHFGWSTLMADLIPGAQGAVDMPTRRHTSAAFAASWRLIGGEILGEVRSRLSERAWARSL